MPELVVTNHAVERLIRRYFPEMDPSNARKYLEDRIGDATPLKEKTILGDDQWQLTDPDMVLVMKREPNKRVCVTILPEPETLGIPEDEMDIIRDRMLDDDGLRTILREERELVRQLGLELSSGQRMHLEQMRVKVERDAAKARRTIAKQYLSNNEATKRQQHRAERAESRNQTLKDALRLVMKHLLIRGDDESLDVVRRVGDIDPDFMSRSFLEPERK